MSKGGRVKAVLPRTKYSNLVTEQSIYACYDLLRTVYPFSSWDLPDKIEVTVQDDHTAYAEFVVPDEINVSKALVWSMDELVRSVAHEMAHMMQYRMGKFDENNPHDALFHKLSREICLSLGWRQQEF